MNRKRRRKNLKGINKVTILLVAVVAIGAFALPSVMSVGLGQHTFKNAATIRGSDDTQNCQKCHGTSAGGGVLAELDRSDDNWQYNTHSGANRVHGSVGCRDCHSATGATGSHTKVQNRPLCVDCHGISTYLVNGSGGVFLDNVRTELVNTSDAHSGLVDTETGYDLNAGCMGCHTGVAVSGSIAFTYDGPRYNVSGLTVGTGGPVSPS